LEADYDRVVVDQPVGVPQAERLQDVSQQTRPADRVALVVTRDVAGKAANCSAWWSRRRSNSSYQAVVGGDRDRKANEHVPMRTV
jgi:hypothetical protein